MLSCIFFLSDWCVDLKVYIIYFLLVSVTLLGVGWRGGSSSLLCPAKIGMVGFPPIIIYSFKRCISTPWIFDFDGLSDMSNMEIYSRDTLWSWGSFLFGCLKCFRRSLRSGQQIFLTDSVRAGVYVPSDIFKDICSGRPVFEWTTARLEVILPRGSCSAQTSTWLLGVLQHSRRDWFAHESVSREVFSRPSFLFISWPRRFQIVRFPSLRQAYECRHLFPFSMRGRG